MTWQEKACNNKWVRVTVSVVLTVAVLLVFVFSPFATAHAIVGASTAVITILIAGLAAIGITFASTGGFDTLEEYVESLLQDYATDNNISVTSVFNGTQYNANSAGKLLLNNRFVLLIDTFAKWLIGKYNLASNSAHTLVQTGGVFGDFVTYSLPITLCRTDSQQKQEFEVYYTEGQATAIYYEDTSFRGVCIIADAPTTIHKIKYNNSGTVSLDDNIVMTMGNIGSSPTYYYWVKSNPDYPKASVNFNGITYYTESQVDTALKTPDLDIDYNNIGVGIKTGAITVPTDDANYAAGDGAVLDVGAKWGSTYGGAIGTVPEIWPNWLSQSQDITNTPDVSIAYESENVVEGQLPAPSDVENLPSGSWFGLPAGFDNLRLSSIWHYVVQWINDTATAGGLLWNTANVMPSPVVNMVFAMVVVAIVFGVLKSLRAH